MRSLFPALSPWFDGGFLDLANDDGEAFIEVGRIIDLLHDVF